MKRLLAFLALCLPIYLFAQGFGSFPHDQPYFAKDRVAGGGGPAGALPPGIQYWWVASDLTNSPVTNWVDRVNGVIWSQPTIAQQPTWDSTNGVSFASASSQYMTALSTFNVNAGTVTTNTFAFILRFTGSTAPVEVLMSGGAGLGLRYTVMDGGSWWNENFGPFGSVVANQWYDWVYAGTNGGPAICQTYTNGVLALSGANLSYVNTNPSDLGRRSTGANYFNGSIREIIVWSNANVFTYSQVSNIHYYATNTYSYTP